MPSKIKTYLLILALTLALTGCGSVSGSHRNMTSEFTPAKSLTTPLKGNVNLGKIIGRKQVYSSTIEVSEKDLTISLEKSLKKATLFNETPESDYTLTAYMQEISLKHKDKEEIVEIGIYYKLIDNASQTKIWATYIESSASISEMKSFFYFFRLKQTVEKAVQNNINKLLESLTKLRT